jgi:hypothetical protein
VIYSLDDLYKHLRVLLEKWQIDKGRYSLDFRQYQLEIWSFDSNPEAGLVPCRFIITLADDSYRQSYESDPEFYVDYATEDSSYTYKVRYPSTDSFLKMLIILRESGPTPGIVRGTLLSKSNKGFTKDEFEIKRRQSFGFDLR